MSEHEDVNLPLWMTILVMAGAVGSIGILFLMLWAVLSFISWFLTVLA